LLRRGDILFNNTNSLALVGKTALFSDDDEPAFSNHMTRLRVKGELADPAFVARFLHGLWRIGTFRQLANNHVSQASVNRTMLEGLPISLPPIVEQRRIAKRLDKVERLRLRTSARLEVGRGTLARLEKAVLSAACTGRISGEWRARNRYATPLPEALLKRKNGDGKPAKSTIDLERPELPDGYVWTTLGDVACVLEYGTSKRCDALGDSGIPVLRMSNIQGGKLSFDDLKYCDSPELDRLLLEDGDLLFNRTNSPELVGKSAVFSGGGRMSFASYLLRVRFDPTMADPEFVNLWINSSHGRHWARLVKTDGVSQANINGTKLASMPLPLPSLAEQKEIVARATAMLMLADSLTTTIQNTVEALDRIGRDSLSKAFRGELVFTEAVLASA
jgi:type I restriction enzyme S subunit